MPVPTNANAPTAAVTDFSSHDMRLSPSRPLWRGAFGATWGHLRRFPATRWGPEGLTDPLARSIYSGSQWLSVAAGLKEQLGAGSLGRPYRLQVTAQASNYPRTSANSSQIHNTIIVLFLTLAVICLSHPDDYTLSYCDKLPFSIA